MEQHLVLLIISDGTPQVLFRRKWSSENPGCSKQQFHSSSIDIYSINYSFVS